MNSTNSASSRSPAFTGCPHLIHSTTKPRTLILLWLGLAMLQVLLLWNNGSLDKLAWRTTRWVIGDQNNYTFKAYNAAASTQPNFDTAPFYQRLNPPLSSKLYKRTESLWRVFRTPGEPAFILILAIALFFFHKRLQWHSAATLLLVTSAAGIASWLLRAISGRYRPNANILNVPNEGDTYWALFRGFSDGSNLSWPSGHATAAFATAGVFAILFPQARLFVIVLAALCAWSRVVMHAHFYSDVLLASLLGWTISALLTPPLLRFFSQFPAPATPSK